MDQVQQLSDPTTRVTARSLVVRAPVLVMGCVNSVQVRSPVSIAHHIVKVFLRGIGDSMLVVLTEVSDNIIQAGPSSGSTLRSPSIGMDFEPVSRG